jgi:hypothetical protein
MWDSLGVIFPNLALEVTNKAQDILFLETSYKDQLIFCRGNLPGEILRIHEHVLKQPH